MNIELALTLILGFVIIYVLLIRFYSTLLRLTGLTDSKAKFQAISLITNSGFTTNEAEIITTNKARRRIASAAMITGHIFSVIIVSLVFNLLNVFSFQALKSNYLTIILVLVIFVAILLVVKIPFVKKGYEKLLEKIALKVMGTTKKENLITLLDNYGKESIAEVVINSLPKFMAEKYLYELNLREDYKLNILSVRRKGRILAIDKHTMLQQGDVLVVFGLHQSIVDLFKNDDGNQVNAESAEVQDKIENSLELIDNFGKEAMIKVKITKVPEFLKNKPLYVCGLKENYNINIMFLVRNKGSLKIDKDTVIQEEDSLIVFGPYVNIKKVFLINS